MKSSVKIRFLIFEIILEIYKKNKSFDTIFETISQSKKISDRDKSLINNVCLNSMRYKFHIDKILKKFLKKKSKTNEYVIFLTSITQIVFLDFKEYAVINSSVEIAKYAGVYPGLINAVLKKIALKKNELKKIYIKFNDLPDWFKKNAKKLTSREKNQFLKNYFKQPSLHIVFKSEKNLKKFNESYFQTTEKSLFITQPKKINMIDNFRKGDWWIQDFSSMLPLYLISTKERKRVLDMCAAPGGKSFQAISNGWDVFVNDMNKKRALILKENLIRLGFDNKISLKNALQLPENKKYDLIILDAPCSAIGTIRKNPEILFRLKSPDFKSLLKNQKDLLQKSTKLLNSGGVILYMVCSFLYNETIEQVNNFLIKNKNFTLQKFKNTKKMSNISSLININGYILNIPNTFDGFMIDGYFAAKLKKND